MERNKSRAVGIPKGNDPRWCESMLQWYMGIEPERNFGMIPAWQNGQTVPIKAAKTVVAAYKVAS